MHNAQRLVPHIPSESSRQRFLFPSAYLGSVPESKGTSDIIAPRICQNCHLEGFAVSLRDNDRQVLWLHCLSSSYVSKVQQKEHLGMASARAESS